MHPTPVCPGYELSVTAPALDACAGPSLFVRGQGYGDGGAVSRKRDPLRIRGTSVVQPDVRPCYCAVCKRWSAGRSLEPGAPAYAAYLSTAHSQLEPHSWPPTLTATSAGIKYAISGTMAFVYDTSF